MPSEHDIIEHEHIHVGAQDAVECLLGVQTTGLVLVERGVEDHGPAEALVFGSPDQHIVAHQGRCWIGMEGV